MIRVSLVMGKSKLTWIVNKKSYISTWIRNTGLVMGMAGKIHKRHCLNLTLEVCANTLCRYYKIVPVNDRKKNRFKKSLWFMLHAYWADFLTDQPLKKNLYRENEEEKIFVLRKIDLICISSSWTYSQSKKIISLSRKVIIKTCS